MFSNRQIRSIFSHTSGHCHFCGDKLRLDLYGSGQGDAVTGAWEADHVIQKGKGGSKSAGNCLPACVRCNRLRWHRKGKQLRELLLLGLVAKDEIKKGTHAGKAIRKLRGMERGFILPIFKCRCRLESHGLVRVCKAFSMSKDAKAPRRKNRSPARKARDIYC